MRDFAGVQMNAWLRQRAAECLLALALGPAFAWISPFGTDEQSFLARLGYWVGLIACWFMAMAVVERLSDAAGILRHLEPLIRGIVIVGVAALPMILVAGPATHALTGWMPTVYEVAELYIKIVILGSAIAVIARAALVASPAAARAASAPSLTLSPVAPLVVDEPSAAPVPGRQHQPLATSRLVERLPPKLRGRLLALEMEDHYVRVHTEHGSALVLLRLSDAITETAPVPGRQVHRSWWVAEDAIAQYERVGRAGRIRLSNGLTAPVSQRYLKELDELLSQPG